MLRELKARPLFLLLLGLLVGLNIPTFSWIFFIGVALGWIFKRYWISLLCVGAYLAGFLLNWRAEPPVIPAGSIHEQVVIHSFPNFARDKSLYTFETIGQYPKSGIIRVEPNLILSPFAVVDVEGKASDTKTGIFTPTKVRVISSYRILDAMVSTQIGAIQRINDLYGQKDGAWVSALTFNFPSDLTSEEKENLRLNGTFHLVSASGMHVFVIAYGLHWLLTLLRLPRHYQIAGILGVLAFYCCITGFHAPTVRASLMWLAGTSAYLFRRSPDGLSALSCSALIWLFFAPQDVFTAGFQLSYIVSGFLLLWFERNWKEEEKKAWDLIKVSVVATLAAEPLSSWWFGRWVFVGPISNLLVELPSSAVMILGFLSMIPVIGQLFAFVAKPIIWWMQWVTTYTAQFPLLMTKRYALPPSVLVAYYCFLFWAIVGRPIAWGDPLKKAKD